MATGQRRRVLGQRGEHAAEEFLRAHGYVIVARNYRSPFGEVDLVVLEGNTIVFVEVRSHSGDRYGDPLHSVTLRKQRQVAKTALYYLTRHSLHEQAARFDVIGIRWEGESCRLTHIPAAFDLPGSF